MINPEQITKFIIRPTLYKLCMLTDQLEHLLIKTIKNESNYGSKLVSDEGVGFGMYFMNSAIHAELWQIILPKRLDILEMISTNFHIYRIQEEERLIFDLEYSTLMAALHYERIESKLPSNADDNSISNHYATFWNKSQYSNVFPINPNLSPVLPSKWDPPI